MIAIAAIAIVGIGASHATPLTLADVSDDWFSSAGNISGDSTDGYLRTFGSTGSVSRSAIEFSLSGLSSGDVVNSAIFRMKSTGTAVAGGNFQFWGYVGDGIVTSSDSYPTSNLLGTLATLGGQPLYLLDVTSFIQSLVNAGNSYAGILITVQEESASTFLGNDIVSRDTATYGFNVADVPAIDVQFSAGSNVPEPDSLLLLGLALTGLVATRRKSKQA